VRQAAKTSAVAEPAVHRIAIGRGIDGRQHSNAKRIAMGLFKPDLYRNFAIGFLVGAVLLAMEGNGVFALIPQTVAATFG